MKRITIPENLTGKSLFDFLVANKSQLIATKKAGLKYTDSIVHQPSIITPLKSVSTIKGVNGLEDVEAPENGVLNVVVVGNTAWWCDSQMDVLTDGCYDKSIKEKGALIPHIADHIHSSVNHVGDVKSVYTKKLTLRELGLDQDGTTTAFVMESAVKEEYNEKAYMFYKNGKINQHSIGLQYVSIGLCINDKECVAEYELWNKYYDKVINKEVINQRGYFWIVPEIKIMENSCVLFGANELTPTLEVTDTGKAAAQSGTDDQPSSNDKSMVLCPNCKTSIKVSEDGSTNCPDCGQYVSPESTTIEVDAFDVLSAIAETKFF
jgi:hypothetical protein